VVVFVDTAKMSDGEKQDSLKREILELYDRLRIKETIEIAPAEWENFQPEPFTENYYLYK